MALNGLLCADVPLSNYSLAHSFTRILSQNFGVCRTTADDHHAGHCQRILVWLLLHCIPNAASRSNLQKENRGHNKHGGERGVCFRSRSSSSSSGGGGGGSFILCCCLCSFIMSCAPGTAWESARWLSASCLVIKHLRKIGGRSLWTGEQTPSRASATSAYGMRSAYWLRSSLLLDYPRFSDRARDKEKGGEWMRDEGVILAVVYRAE